MGRIFSVEGIVWLNVESRESIVCIGETSSLYI